MKTLFAVSFMVGIFVVSGLTVCMAEMWPLKIERVDVLSQGQMFMSAGLAYEKNREYMGNEYDNVRLAPFGLRYGLGDSVEAGGFLSYSSNSANDDGAPDKSGLEGVTFFGKLSINNNFAIQVGGTFLGDDSVAPYANDGLDIFVNVPMQLKLGQGMLYGQFGYRVQGGDYDGTSYFNYGIGYGKPFSKQLALNVELVGEEFQRNTQHARLSPRGKLSGQ